MIRADHNTREPRKVRLAILVNTIAPYRLPIYAVLAQRFETLVLHGGSERNRNWTLDIPAGVETRRVWTLQVPIKKQTGVGGVWDTQYIHFKPGTCGMVTDIPAARDSYQ